jgi:hypothetical protein
VFGGAVGGTTALASLTTNAGGTTAINGGLVTTSGAQSYNDVVTLGAATTLNGSAVGFATTLDGGFGLTVNSAGATVFGGAVGGTTALASLTTNAAGATAINGGLVTTSGAQSYNDVVTLGATTSLNGSAVGFATTLDGAFGLTVNSAGATVFGGAVGGTTALASLTTNAGGTTAINGGLVTTSGAQSYNDVVTLGAATTLNGSAIGFATTLDGAFALTANSAGATVFGGAVGGIAALASLTTDTGGTVAVATNITTSGAQGYGDALTLTGNATLASTGNAAIGFGSSVDGAFGLTVVTTSTTSFTGAVGGATALASLATNAGGSTLINGGLVTTSGAQAYGDAVRIGAATTLNGANIGFATTLDGGFALAVNDSAATVFGGAVGGTTALASLATNAGGSTAINGGSVTTTATQSYGDAVTIGTATTLRGTDIGFATTLDGAQTLTVSGTGLTSFGGAVGGTAALASLTLDAGGTTSIGGGSIRTTGTQSYTEAVSFTGATSFTGGDIGFTAIDGNAAATLTGGAIAGTSLRATSAAIGATGAVTLTTLTATTGDATIVAGGAVALAGNVVVGGNYSVTGTTIALGNDADSETHSAGGRVVVKATAGNIVGGVGLTLVSNSGGVADTSFARSLNLDATGSILFDTSSTLNAGPARQSAIGIGLRSGGTALALGTVSAAAIRSVNGDYSAYVAPIATSGEISLVALTTTDAIGLTTSAGSIRGNGFTSTAGGIMLTASGGVSGLGSNRTAISAAAAGQAVTIAAGAALLAGPITAGGALTTSAASADVTTATAGSTLTLGTTGGSIALVTATAGGAATIDAATSADIGTATAGAALAVTTRGGNLVFGQGGGATTTSFTVAQKAFLAGAGTVYAGGTSPTAANVLTLTARDADLNGAVRAGAVTIVNSSPTNVLRLGDGLTGSAGFDLTTTEINRIATASLALNAQGRDVAMGTIPLAATTGSSFFGVLGTGRIDITGTLTATPAGRTIQLGGSRANTTDKASFIRIAATVDGGGRLYVDNAALDLRGVRIAVGQDTGFISTVAGQSTADVVTNFVAQPNSTLYNSQALGAGGLYTAPDLIRTATLSVRFTDYALFQNTGISGQTSGVVINSDARPTLSVSGSGSGAANAAALFGTINGRDGNSAALLGPDVIATNDLNLNNSRINGCLVGSGGGGCLISSIATPQIQVFDPNQINLFRSADDLALAFDPVVGGNNESLFSDIGTIEFLTDDEPEKGECDPNKGGGCAAKDKDGANR